MAVLSPRTRSDSPTTLYSPRRCSPTKTAAATIITPFISSGLASSSPVVLHRSPSTPRSIGFSVDRNLPTQPKSSRSHCVVPVADGMRNKKACLCSPTTHPGSFRCSMHKNQPPRRERTAACQSSLNMRRSAMTNSLVRIGAVEGDLVKRALSAVMIRPSSHNQHRREEFQPRPSRLSVMSRASEDS